MSNSISVGAAFKYNDSSNRGPDEDESFTVVTSRRKRRQQEKRRGGPLITPEEALKRTSDTLYADKKWLAHSSSTFLWFCCNVFTKIHRTDLDVIRYYP